VEAGLVLALPVSRIHGLATPLTFYATLPREREGGRQREREREGERAGGVESNRYSVVPRLQGLATLFTLYGELPSRVEP
jgi:hypothetical protein